MKNSSRSYRVRGETGSVLQCSDKSEIKDSSNPLDDYEIPDERCEVKSLHKFEGSYNKKFIRTLKSRFPHSKCIRIFTEISKPKTRLNASFKKELLSPTKTLESEKGNYFFGMCKKSLIAENMNSLISNNRNLEYAISKVSQINITENT